jgi:hypothetical protein
MTRFLEQRSGWWKLEPRFEILLFESNQHYSTDI